MPAQGRFRKDNNMLKRHWMNEITESKIDYLASKLPYDILEHALNLIEIMDGSNPIDLTYRESLVDTMFNGLVEDKNWWTFCGSCEQYNIYHEFCLYLDGWTWNVVPDPDEDNTNSEICQIRLTKLN